MEMAGKIKRTARRGIALGVCVSALAFSADSPSDAYVRYPRLAAVTTSVTGHNPDAQTTASSEAARTTPSSSSLSASEQSPTTRPPKHHVPDESLKIRNWFAQSLPTRKLVALKVSPRAQAQFPDGLFVTVPGSNCAAVTEFESQNGKIKVENNIFGRPKDIVNPKVLEGPQMYSGVIGHGDTDALVALGRNPVELVKPTIPSVGSAIVALTARVCNLMPPG